MRHHRLLVAGVGLAAVLTIGLWLGYAVQNRSEIRLDVSLNSSSVSRGQTIHVSMAVRNNLLLSNDPPESRAWPVENMSMGDCANGPIVMAVYSGRLTVQNYSGGRWLNVFGSFHLGQPWIFPLGSHSCPVTHFRLWPLESISRDVDLRGEWALAEVSCGQYGGSACYQSFLHPFSVGVYTLFVGDVWGHFIIRYFTVLSS